MTKFLGIALIIFALAIAVVPFFTDCQSQGKALTLANGTSVPMKCHWTGLAEIATSVPLIVVGAMMVANRRKENLLNLGILGSILGILVILLPTNLIGVCQSAMLCNTAMKPALIVLGSLAIVASLAAIVLARKTND